MNFSLQLNFQIIILCLLGIDLNLSINLMTVVAMLQPCATDEFNYLFFY